MLPLPPFTLRCFTVQLRALLTTSMHTRQKSCTLKYPRQNFTVLLSLICTSFSAETGVVYVTRSEVKVQGEFSEGSVE